MARIPVQHDPNRIEELLLLVNKSYGKTIRHSFECDQLSSDIRLVTDQYISAQTLRRIFGLLKSPFFPSAKTLNILSVYAGFSDWEEYLNSNTNEFEPLTLKQEVELYRDLYAIDITEEADMNYHNVCRNVAWRIVTNPSLLNTLSPFLAKNPVSQEYFFERFPYIDGLCSSYRNSLHLFMQKKKDHAPLFANCLLFLSAYLCGNHKQLKTLIAKINLYQPSENMHPFLIARHIGSNLLYASLLNEPKEKLFNQALQWNKHFIKHSTIRFWNYPCFQHLMIEYLILSGLFEESRILFESLKQFEGKKVMESGYAEGLMVLEKISLSEEFPDVYKNWFLTTHIFKSVNPFFRKYYQLLALKTFRSLAPEAKVIKTNYVYNNLLAETGFAVFLEN